VIEIGSAWPEGQRVDGIGNEIVPDVEDARSFVASQAVDVFRPIGFATADRAIVDGMREGVTGFKREAVAQMALESETEGIVSTRTDVALVVHGAKRISVGVILIQRPHAIAVDWVESQGNRAQIDRAGRRGFPGKRLRAEGSQEIRVRWSSPTPRRKGCGGPHAEGREDARRVFAGARRRDWEFPVHRRP